LFGQLPSKVIGEYNMLVLLGHTCDYHKKPDESIDVAPEPLNSSRNWENILWYLVN
jgi:hypothetical protein